MQGISTPEVKQYIDQQAQTIGDERAHAEGMAQTANRILGLADDDDTEFPALSYFVGEDALRALPSPAPSSATGAGG